MDIVIENNITLGNKEVIVGGWGAYEIEKRSLRSRINGDKYNNYYTSKYIHPQHVINSVLGGCRHNSSCNAINKFINKLRAKELDQNSLNDIWIIPSLTSNRLHSFIKNDVYDPDEIQKINIYLKKYADVMNLDITLDDLKNININKFIN